MQAVQRLLRYTIILQLVSVYVLLECLTCTCYIVIGDFRMIVGEDKNKVRNIVSPHLDQFDHLYHDSLNTDYLSIGHHHITQV